MSRPESGSVLRQGKKARWKKITCRFWFFDTFPNFQNPHVKKNNIKNFDKYPQKKPRCSGSKTSWKMQNITKPYSGTQNLMFYVFLKKREAFTDAKRVKNVNLTKRSWFIVKSVKNKIFGKKHVFGKKSRKSCRAWKKLVPTGLAMKNSNMSVSDFEKNRNLPKNTILSEKFSF